MTDGGPGTATWTPALFMQKFTFGRNEMGMGAASAIIMMMMIFSIIVPYLYSELKGGRRQ
jgi:glucose/mannose transport system permease protein